MHTVPRWAAPVAVLAVLAACDATVPSPLSPDRSPSAASALSDPAPVERPWTGRCDGEGTTTTPTTLVITGTCQLSHLGRVTFVTNETLAPGPVTTFDNTTTYTAANGDLLYTSGTGVATFNADGTVGLQGTWTVVGGTGRFDGASGTAAHTGVARFTGPTSALGSYTLDGWLAY